MVVLFLLIFLFSTKTVLATPSVSITSVPEIVIAGNTFPVSFTINEASSSAVYYYKFFGGIDADVYKITNNSDLSYTSSWTNFPQVSLNPNSSQNSFDGFAFIKADAVTGTYNIKIKIALTTNTGTSVTSPSFPLEVAAPSPTPTSAPTPTETPTPTATLTPTPSPTNTPPPTKTPTFTITPTITEEETNIDDSFAEEDISSNDTNSPTPEVLGESTTRSPSKINIIPLIFIITGALLLLTPLILTKLKKHP